MSQRVVAGRFVLQEPLGHGGMGTVWRAQDQVLGRTVALKEVNLPPAVPEEERQAMRQRVLREARAAARLNHPAAVMVFDVIEEGDNTFIAMEIVESPTLSQMVSEQGPLTPERTAFIGLRILDALDAAHRQGIIHRDVKPANVIVGEEHVKLADFGVASVKGDPRLTATGLLLGSPSYMSPEQVEGKAAGPPSDLWALGATMYFAVEGHGPFDRPGALPTLMAISKEELTPPEHAGPLTRVILSLLNKNPDRRPLAGRLRVMLEDVADAFRSEDDGTLIDQPDHRLAMGAGLSAASALRPTEAVAPGPETMTPEPKPVAPLPEPMAPVPEPAAAQPEDMVPQPEPMAPLPDPAAPQPEDMVPEPEPMAPLPEPAAPQPESMAPLPELTAPQPEDIVPQPEPMEAPGPMPPEAESMKPQPKAMTPQPDSELLRPGPSETAEETDSTPAEAEVEVLAGLNEQDTRTWPDQLPKTEALTKPGPPPEAVPMPARVSQKDRSVRATATKPEGTDGKRYLVFGTVAAVLILLALIVLPRLGSEPSSTPGAPEPADEGRSGAGGVAGAEGQDGADGQRGADGRDGDRGRKGGAGGGQPSALPAGWRAAEIGDTGFRMGHPADWRVVRNALGDGSSMRFEGGSGMYLLVDWTDRPGQDATAAWEQQAAGYSRRHANYRQIRIEPTEFRDFPTAAIWEWTYSSRGADLHAINLGFADENWGMALNFQTRADDWQSSLDTFETFKATFGRG
jgi:serine/threonine protein kinase